MAGGSSVGSMAGNIQDQPERCDVVILGAGVAGLTAAHGLPSRNVIVLEARDRVGGRTLSGGDDDAWFNTGAQLITSPRMAELCRELGLDLVSAKAADFGFGVRGRFARATSPERLLLRMNLTLAEKADFARASLRLRRTTHAIPTMGVRERLALDRLSLMEAIGRVAPSTNLLFGACCESGAGLSLDRISALVGISYALTAFIDPKGKETLYGVRGGTQQVSLAIARRLKPDRLRLGCRVLSARTHASGVTVGYVDHEGNLRTIEADRCICALPAGEVLRVVDGLGPQRRASLARLTPYSTLISVAWPVKDGVKTPWDGVFIAPVAGEAFTLFTNYGFLSKQRDPRLGGFVNTLAAGLTASRYAELDDGELLALQHAELLRLFPAAADLLDVGNVVVQRWEQGGLPPMRPGYYAERQALREPLGHIHFCGDYTSEPGLPGANGSGHYAALTVAKQREQAAVPAGV